jgi:hypothetical protein
MHPLFAEGDGLSGEVIGAAIDLHRMTGPGLFESSSTEFQGSSYLAQTIHEQKETKTTKRENRAESGRQTPTGITR